MLEKFKVLGLSEATLKILQKKGFEEPTKIQELAIPLLLEGETDVVGQAQTGTGKTAAFGLPILERIPKGTNKVQAIVLVPTRELALQVSEEINSLRTDMSIRVIAIYGGQSMEQQLFRLRRGVDIVVGTPGRIMDHLQRGTLDLKSVSFVVLDEADEMLNMGFIDDIELILKYTAEKKRMLLFSATMPSRILQLAENYMGEYKIVRVNKEQLTVNLTDQIYFEVNHYDKLEALCRIIDSEPEFFGLIFCRTKVDVDTIAKKLMERGYDAEGLHGDISQSQRERILGKFKQKLINVLVASDVAARGIDITGLSHVINYSLPQDPESYVHRIGRTGRAGKEGTAITFVTPDEYRQLILIKRITKSEIRKEKIPTIDDVIKSKKVRIRNEIAELVESSGAEDYMEFARELLEGGAEPEKVLAAFLKHTFHDELNPGKYNEIRDVSVDTKGTTRLFVARGRSDGMSPRVLIDMIQKTADINPRKIGEISIFDKFSFVNVPFEEAEIILNAFKNDRGHSRPIVTRAKERTTEQRGEQRSNHRRESRSEYRSDHRREYRRR